MIFFTRLLSCPHASKTTFGGEGKIRVCCQKTFYSFICVYCTCQLRIVGSLIVCTYQNKSIARSTSLFIQFFRCCYEKLNHSVDALSREPGLSCICQQCNRLFFKISTERGLELILFLG